jgi:Putative transposase
LYPIDSLRNMYKAKFMAALRKLIKQGKIQKQEPKFLDLVYKKEWVVYAKRPFKGANSVIEYLGRYTHKVAISNHRLQNIDEKEVTFSYKDYADKSKTKKMSLVGQEFLRRFSQHILPKKFTKIRHFGLHAGASHKIMDSLFEQFHQKPRPKLVRRDWKQIAYKKSGFIAEQCPCCKQNTMQTVGSWHAGRSPPLDYNILIFNNLEAIG